MKTTVSYKKGHKVKLEMDVEFAAQFQNLLLYYIATAKDPKLVIEGYKKITDIINNKADIQLDDFETYLYCITALCQNIKKAALEQGAAEEIEVPDEVAEKSKLVAQLIFENKDENKEKVDKLYSELLDHFNTSS